ncbi:MAG: phosphoenolpyruvate--protein phosphotransferase [Rhodospirillaceae bacterium]|nr:phosphoenolpyruvate--protein phosphotransferase [Rhodospirillaceae bacterium]
MTAFSAGDLRQMLARMRDVMAGMGSVQERLDKVVTLIAQGLRADVCSCYVMRAGEVLELFATFGLSQRAVHITRLRVGEGLVGEIAAHAEPISLADAWSHPAFVYRPETGEDFFRSLMGVPMIQAGRVVGVLAVQTREERPFNDWEVETLETVAMVIAELMAAAHVVKREELFPAEGNALLPVRLTGVALNAGIALGQAVMHKPHVRIGRLVADDPAVEKERLQSALAILRRDVDALLSSSRGEAAGFGDILEVYRMFADDRGWIARIGEVIDTGLTAEAAVQKVSDDTRVRMQQMSDPLFRERLQDLDDLANRLLAILAGGGMRTELPDNAILVCRSLGPTELLDYDRRKIKGLIMEEGSPTMHAVVVAKALDIPVLAQVQGALSRIDAYDLLALDASAGQVFLRPSEDVQELYAAGAEARVRQKAAYAARKDLPSVTRDGVEIKLQLNAGFLIDVQALDETGADGIGLFRTEMQFLALPTLPDVKTQQGLYKQALDAANGRPITFRTLDVGGDKIASSWSGAQEDNPAMGWRSIRLTLDRPSVMRQQLRAIIQACQGRELRVMFPMIASVAEFEASRRIFDMEFERHLSRGGQPPSSVAVGTMLEVPALLWQLDQLLSRIDFLSVGSNDLVQFMFAADRGNTRIADRYDVLSAPVLRMLRFIAERSNAAEVELSLCGEMAGRPLEALALVALGYRTLSMSAAAIGPVRDLIRQTNLKDLEDFVTVLMTSDAPSLRTEMRGFAQDHGILAPLA